MRTACVLLLLAGVAHAGESKAVKHDFEAATVGSVPKGWTVARTGTGEGSDWKVVEDETAPKGPKVLAQTAESPGPMFNLCVADDTGFKDVEITVAFKAVKGKKDQGGGVVWRYRDENNYYVARFNPLEDNYRLYKVVAGKRTQLETKEDLKVPAGEWHTLSIKMVGDRIECYLDGKKQLEAKDDAFTRVGKVGLWTKADAQTYFDDFRAEELTK
jgi:3-keto-disaccharide hydrolase